MGTSAAKVAFIDTSGAVFNRPKQLGPTMRMLWARADRRMAAWAATPCSPASANPAETTTSAPTPLRPHASTVSATLEAGTAMTARSTWSGTASMPDQHGMLATWSVRRLIG